MVTISKPLAATQARRYHANEFSNPRENYYSRDGAMLGQWHGQFAAELGLTGAVSVEQFSRMAEGQDPHTGEQLIQHRERHEYKNERGEAVKSTEHRAGWDATFSAPKSVSLTALVGGDSRITEAHQASVKSALDEMEHYVQARMGGTRPARTTGKWAVAMFEHDTARPVAGYAAPQLHTHCVFFNMTTDDTGQRRALDPRELFESQQLATAVYQSELARQLRGLGYEVETGGNGAPEIAGDARRQGRCAVLYPLGGPEERKQAMSKTLDEKFNELGPERRQRIEARANELIAAEMSLRELRRAHRLTQKHMAKKLGIGQEGVSRLEQRSDLLISTLRGYVEAMGGSLSIIAAFPDRQPVVLAGLASLDSTQNPRPQRGS